MIRRTTSAVAILLLLAVFSFKASLAAPLELYVATDGDDDWNGRQPTSDLQNKQGPFATLQRARDELRRLRVAGHLSQGAVIFLRGGRYELSETFELTAEDSGTAAAPIRYTAFHQEQVTLSGSRGVKDFVPVSDEDVFVRLVEAARGKVLQADLKSNGITDFGEVVTAGKRLELFFAGEPMRLARWPNHDFIRILAVTGGKPFKVHGVSGDRIGRFTYKADRPARWAEESDLWLHGYWFWDWSDAYQKVKTLDHDKREISLVAPYHGYGYRPGQRFYALNALSELDTPGEWYVDRQRGLLYFWPPSNPRQPRATVSILPTLIDLEDASHVTFEKLTLEETRATAVQIRGGRHSSLVGCTIRNTGSWGVKVSGRENGVVGCDLYRTAEGGVALQGGDRKTLTPAGLFARNNHIHHFGRLYRTYRPAVLVGGVGNQVVHNEIHDGPHNAIQLSGNDHRIEFNEIYDVCYETGDVGAFYMGRDWTARGTLIRHNFFHHIKGPGLHGAMSVYLDDAASGIEVYGNIFFRAGRAAFIGGGRDNRVVNNVFVECEPSVHVDDRGLNWMRYHVEKEGIMPRRLEQMPYKSPPWSTRYPGLVNLLDDDPGAPKGNVVAHNIGKGGRWRDIAKQAEPLVTFENNLIDEDPLFIDAGRMNFQLRDDSPAYRLGFKKIPFAKIGVYEDPRRASWPVANTRRDRNQEQ